MKVNKYFPLLVLFSCGSDETSDTETSSIEIISDTVDAELSSFESEWQLPPVDPDKTYKANILQATTYHEDEVMTNVEELEWWGLFEDEDGNCTLKKTKVTGERVEDVISDNEGEKTGWDISTDDERNSVILINGLDFLTEGSVYTLHRGIMSIKPGDEIQGDHAGRLHRFYATGKMESGGLGDNCPDYKLFYEVTENGEKRTQQIKGLMYGYDCLATIYYIGDIDMDGYLDIITDNTDHYNVMLPTLYLSRPAKKGDLLIKIGEHRSVGC